MSGERVVLMGGKPFMTLPSLQEEAMSVLTTHGLVERAALTTKDVITESDSSRIVATEWYLKDELVRRDVWVNGLRGLDNQLAGRAA